MAAKIPDLSVSFESRDEYLQQLLGKNRGDVVIEVHAEDIKDLQLEADAVSRRFLQNPSLANVRTSLALGEEEVVLEPDRDALLRGEYQVSDLASQIDAYLNGKKSEIFKLDRGEMAIAVGNASAETQGMKGLMELPIISKSEAREKLANPGQHPARARSPRSDARQPGTHAAGDGRPQGRPLRPRFWPGCAANLDAMAWRRGESWNVSGEEVKPPRIFSKNCFSRS